MKKGTDISGWQGKVDWGKVASRGIEWAGIRCAYGLTKDEQFTNNWNKSRDAGIKRTAYLYFKANQSPIAQAQYLRSLAGDNADFNLVLDAEKNTGDVMTNYAAKLLECCAELMRVGFIPVIYTSPGFAASYLTAPEFSLFPLWVAHWNAAAPKIPPPWFGGDYWAWQFRVTTDGLWYGAQSRTLDLDVMP